MILTRWTTRSKPGLFSDTALSRGRCFFWLCARSATEVLRLRHISYAAQIVKRENAGGVAVGPDGLDSVAADIAKAHQLECAAFKLLIRTLVNITHYVHLSLAAGAGAMATQFLERDEAFGA